MCRGGCYVKANVKLFFFFFFFCYRTKMKNDRTPHAFHVYRTDTRLFCVRFKRENACVRFSVPKYNRINQRRRRRYIKAALAAATAVVAAQHTRTSAAAAAMLPTVNRAAEGAETRVNRRAERQQHPRHGAGWPTLLTRSWCYSSRRRYRSVSFDAVYSHQPPLQRNIAYIYTINFSRFSYIYIYRRSLFCFIYL